MGNGLGPFSAAPPGFETRSAQDTRWSGCGPVSGGVTYGKHLFCTIFTVQFKLLWIFQIKQGNTNKHKQIKVWNKNTSLTSSQLVQPLQEGSNAVSRRGQMWRLFIYYIIYLIWYVLRLRFNIYRLEDNGILDHDVSITGQSCLFMLWSVLICLTQAFEKTSLILEV